MTTTHDHVRCRFRQELFLPVEQTTYASLIIAYSAAKQLLGSGQHVKRDSRNI